MPTNTHRFPSRVPSRLRFIALALLLVNTGLWISTGAHLGWTVTNIAEVHHDEITGIDYPVRKKTFIAGIEIPVLGLAAALALGGASFAFPRRSTTLDPTAIPTAKSSH